PDMDSHDAAALFWYARNSLFFSGGFHEDDRVRLCRYSDLVTRPAEIMTEAYRFIDRPYPGDRIVADVFSSSRGRGVDLELSPPVRKLCEGMLARLANHQVGQTK
ncbi:MAG: sulfotransferase family protein, partial [Holophagae bacterium]|nr:sulfotransferase family protein [Holophagae bacterium]